MLAHGTEFGNIGSQVTNGTEFGNIGSQVAN